MDSRKITQFVKVREELTAELENVEAEIMELSSQMTALMARSEELRSILGQFAPKKTSNIGDRTQLLVTFVRDNPGCNRQDILAGVEAKTESSVISLIGRASYLGLIENRGTRRHSEWHLTEKGISLLANLS
jgi:hypothetical protein